MIASLVQRSCRLHEISLLVLREDDQVNRWIASLEMLGCRPCARRSLGALDVLEAVLCTILVTDHCWCYDWLSNESLRYSATAACGADHQCSRYWGHRNSGKCQVTGRISQCMRLVCYPVHRIAWMAPMIHGLAAQDWSVDVLIRAAVWACDCYMLCAMHGCAAILARWPVLGASGDVLYDQFHGEAHEGYECTGWWIDGGLSKMSIGKVVGASMAMVPVRWSSWLVNPELR